MKQNLGIDFLSINRLKILTYVISSLFIISNRSNELFEFRYVGSVCGMMYIFTLPSLVRLASQRKAGESSWMSILVHVVLILIGLANLIAQFFVAA